MSSKPAPAKKTAAAPLKEDLFASKPSGSKKTRAEDNLFDKPPEDIFTSGSSKAKRSTNDDIFAASKGGEDTKKLDDIFADAPPKKRTSQKTKKEVEKPPTEEGDGVRLLVCE